ncbi:hypothetical protein PENTCL1PPCAC_15282, partial [Pristionchus entomophagus]
SGFALNREAIRVPNQLSRFLINLDKSHGVVGSSEGMNRQESARSDMVVDIHNVRDALRGSVHLPYSPDPEAS